MNKVNVEDVFVQLGDFAESLRHQLQENVVKPLGEYQSTIAHAARASRAFDEESEALDAASLKYLSMSRDAPLEVRAPPPPTAAPALTPPSPPPDCPRPALSAVAAGASLRPPGPVRQARRGGPLAV